MKTTKTSDLIPLIMTASGVLLSTTALLIAPTPFGMLINAICLLSFTVTMILS